VERNNVKLDEEILKKEATIYKDLQPGSFLYGYRSKLNAAAYEIALG
jgi:hypothetical protein